MAAAPMYVQQRLVGVLNLASKDPHAFDRWGVGGWQRGLLACSRRLAVDGPQIGMELSSGGSLLAVLMYASLRPPLPL